MSDLDTESWTRFRAKCGEEKVSARKLIRNLVSSWLDKPPVYRLVYEDPTVHVNAPGSEYPVTLKECIGWPISEDKEKITLAWDRTLNSARLPNLQNPAGPSPVYSVPRRSIVEMRRLTA